MSRASRILFMGFSLGVLLPAESFLSVAPRYPPTAAVTRNWLNQRSPARIDSPRLAALPEGYTGYGNDCIERAALMVGARMEQLDVQWKPGRIVITVKDGRAYLPEADDENEEDDLIEDDGYDDEEEGEEEDSDDAYDDYDDMDMVLDEIDSSESSDNARDGSESSSSPGAGLIDLSRLARAVNAALEDDGLGARIAETHEIEITTPGASDELHFLLPSQLAAYKGFDVNVVYVDVKKGNAVKTLQGRLVGREDGMTTVNMKGRMKKISNGDIQSIRLPKAKKE